MIQKKYDIKKNLNFPNLGFLSMTKTRSGMIMALLAISVLSVPILFADALADFLDVTSAKEIKVKVTPDTVKELKIKTDSSIPVDGSGGAFGYGMISANGNLKVATTHGGVYDSDAQTAPTLIPVAVFSPKAQICAAADPGCEPVWHTHAVELTSSAECIDLSVDMGVVKNPAPGTAVGKISWQDVADKTEIKGKNNGELKIKDSPLGIHTWMDSLTDSPHDFDFDDYVGGPIVSFTIDIRGSSVCIDNIQAVGTIPLAETQYKLKN
jgi:hypothetical protein